MEFDQREAQAREFAVAAHGDQRYGELPYITHLTAVRAVLDDFGFGGDLAVAAWLHDIIEDTPVTAEEVESRFGRAVLDLVWAVTGVGPDRKSRNLDAYTKIAAHPRAVILKLADRTANAEASPPASSWMGMYRTEHPTFTAHLGGLLADDPTVARMWARLDRRLDPTVAAPSAQWAEIDRLVAAGEHVKAVDAVRAAFECDPGEAERILAERS
ncbi:HD domain-containing protein [Nocardia caishijiensis]|uniref:HD domain-containing protein n=1 Tax=Nocardia caishijiensis TaxID=184756 RepID=A0ABQ6YIK8_9NOCA|nr:HD domain-containing protein [Nocardia caishijiensis]KAF0845627.1 HD domain-containing protein [Nocardia caishijiensis]